MISIITPVLNEATFIKTYFENINRLIGDFELIIVDGGSTDDTIDQINVNKNQFNQEIKLIKTVSGRGYQMNKGASFARGNILLFLHVDCTLESDIIPTIQKEFRKDNVVGGGMIQTFLKTDNFLKLLSNLGNLRTRFNSIFFGDYGFFIKKDIFEKIGGYDEIDYLEDIELSKKAKKYGKLRQINRKIYTSPRRFLEYGKIKITMIFVIAILLNTFGLRPRYLKRFIVDSNLKS